MTVRLIDVLELPPGQRDKILCPARLAHLGSHGLGGLDNATAVVAAAAGSGAAVDARQVRLYSQN